MAQYESDWVFNLILKLAVVVCLGSLVLSLISGVGPLTALLRGGTAFITFASLGWAASLVWEVPEMENAPVQADDTAMDKDESPINEQSSNEETLTTDNEA